MKKNRRLLFILLSVLAALIIFLVVMGIGIYKYDWDGNFTKRVYTAIPYPAAVVNMQMLTYNQWQNRIEQYQQNKNFYLQEQEIDLGSLDLPDDETINDKALDDLIKEKILSKLAKQNKINASEQEIDSAYNELILSRVKNGEESAERALQDIYGMSVHEFKKQVVEDYLLRQKLEDKLNQEGDELDKLAKVKAQEVLDEVKQAEVSFDTLARMYSEDGSALTGGDMGYIQEGETTDLIDKAAFSLQPGEISDLLRSQQGYHIITVEDIKEEEGEKQVKVRYIFIAADIDKLLDQEMSNARIWRLVK